jgi:sarcosine oxidase
MSDAIATIPKIDTVPARSSSGSSEHHECVVVGAGVLGLAAAWSLSRRGHEVLVLESDEPGHARSGSHGSARIFRLSYPDPLYVQMALEAQGLWHVLERESGRSLLHQTGQVSFGRDLDTLAEAMALVGAPFARLSPDETLQRFPHLQVGGDSLFEEGSGVLEADVCLQALHDTGSFELRRHCGVRAVQDDRNGATIFLDSDENLSADVVVNCAGQAAIAIMDGVHAPAVAAPSLQQVVYLRAIETGPPVPVFIEWGDDMIYGLPVVGRDVVKLSHHTVGPVGYSDDDENHDDPELLEILRDAASRLLPSFSPAPVATERCVYDNTIDSDFIIDRLGHVVVGCGTSGHGFKFGPLLGELMADLATGTEPAFSLDRFAVRRSLLRLLPNP